ncbi:hypothetical protein B296_00008458 [Ensete ventricosum]|uniref:Uncharacterized protein n=1 Tax=Ensete ventricosum TaxID=4639 RepID=A0A427B139_ENSVE|nr:hypothetical protein B296_00008458 [Ensete ventricosum]
MRTGTVQTGIRGTRALSLSHSHRRRTLGPTVFAAVVGWWRLGWARESTLDFRWILIYYPIENGENAVGPASLGSPTATRVFAAVVGWWRLRWEESRRWTYMDLIHPLSRSSTVGTGDRNGVDAAPDMDLLDPRDLPDSEGMRVRWEPPLVTLPEQEKVVW